jgi:hypothetical protein
LIELEKLNNRRLKIVDIESNSDIIRKFISEDNVEEIIKLNLGEIVNEKFEGFGVKNLLNYS